MLHVENARKGFFEPEQYRAVVKQLPEHLRPLAAIAYITGWRAMSELLSRQWRHVDLGKGWLRLDPGESKNGEGREFPFTPDMRSVLENQREIVRTIEREQACVIPWVFVQADGSRIKDFRWAWRKACRDAGVPGRLVHDFRRTAVRNLERAGVPRSAAMRMTGHKTKPSIAATRSPIPRCCRRRRLSSRPFMWQIRTVQVEFCFGRGLREDLSEKSLSLTRSNMLVRSTGRVGAAREAESVTAPEERCARRRLLI
jgi:integrase